MRQQLKASSKTASKEKVPLGFIWPGLPDSLPVSLHGIKQMPHKITGPMFGPIL